MGIFSNKSRKNFGITKREQHKEEIKERHSNKQNPFLAVFEARMKAKEMENAKVEDVVVETANDVVVDTKAEEIVDEPIVEEVVEVKDERVKVAFTVTKDEEKGALVVVEDNDLTPADVNANHTDDFVGFNASAKFYDGFATELTYEWIAKSTRYAFKGIDAEGKEFTICPNGQKWKIK